MEKKMKKILATITAIAIAATMVITPASADNSEEIAIGVGAFLGGLIIGEAVRPRPRYVERVYVEEPIYVRECYTKIVRRYDPHTGRYYKAKRKVCQLVPAY